jgi:hypothetical protein
LFCNLRGNLTSLKTSQKEVDLWNQIELYLYVELGFLLIQELIASKKGGGR